MPLKIQQSATSPIETTADVVTIAVYAGATIKDEPLGALDRALDGGLGKLLQRAEFKGKKEQVVDFPTLGKLPASRVIIFGLGARDGVTDADLRAYAAKAARSANDGKATSLALGIPDGIGGERLRFLAEGVVLGAYKFLKYLTGDRRPKAELQKVLLASEKGEKKKKGAAGDGADKAIALGQKVAEAVCITRDLVNEPGNELTPAGLADTAARISKQFGLRCQVFDAQEIEKRGMKLLTAVGQGSVNEPRFVHMTYAPKKKAARKIAFVGKGLTFDSGGLCIKPAPGMGEMKADMAGAANVVGLMAAIAALAPEIEVHGIVAAAENMPDGNAYRPGDVFGSLDGKTVEIVNTDAEGRLVLADALAYARALDPEVIVNNATLTGACVIALGKNCSAFYSTADDISDKFGAAAKEAGEQFWRMPFLEDLKDQLKSDIADLKHVADRWGGSISAALFLREFVGECPFLHADIAGPSFADRPAGMYPKGGTGHGVLTFLQFVEKMA